MGASTYVDFDLLAQIDTLGGILLWSGADALYNALSEWLTSSMNQYIRQPNLGGILTSIIDKTMSDDRANTIRTRLYQGLQTEFNPEITVVNLTVTPQYEDDTYLIEILGYAASLKLPIKYSQAFKGA